MNSDNLSALTVGVGVVALIIGFGVYFNSPELNNAASLQQKNFVPAAIFEENGTITRVQIDKSQFKLAPELSKNHKLYQLAANNACRSKGQSGPSRFGRIACINCIRTIPYLNTWHEKYADDWSGDCWNTHTRI